MEENVIFIAKKSGQTPLECIDELKKSRPELKHVPMTYAGRLDPLAEGVLLILVGDECMKKDEYVALPKEYDVTILFGFSTDTYDVLGKVEDSDVFVSSREKDFLSSVRSVVPKFIGSIVQKYPAYSSRTVEGKPLYQWAREGKIHEIMIPSHTVHIESIDSVQSDMISGLDLRRYIEQAIAGVNGDFRQNEIRLRWDDILTNVSERFFPTVTLRISCGSGVYVRALAHDIGKELKVPALALKIVRTKVGNYRI